MQALGQHCLLECALKSRPAEHVVNARPRWLITSSQSKTEALALIGRTFKGYAVGVIDPSRDAMLIDDDDVKAGGPNEGVRSNSCRCRPF
jgi:hypothetical protein